MVVTMLVGGAVASAVEVSLRGEVRLDRAVVRLGDVAEVIAFDTRCSQQLAELILMPAPAPGTQRFLSRREVQDLLAAHGEAVRQVRFAGAEQVAIVGAAAASAEQPGSEAIRREASRRSALSRGDLTFGVSAPRNDQQVQQVRGEIERLILEYVEARAGQSGARRAEIEIAERHLRQLAAATTAPACMGGAAPWTGRQRFVISFNTVEGETSVPVYADVAMTAPVVVATRSIERGATITAADLELQTINEPPHTSGKHVAAKSIEELVGLEAAKAIQAGEVIYTDHAQPPLLVKRGDEISVTTQGGGIRVRTVARARTDGARGDLIEVETLETKERFDVRVVGQGQAAVFSGTRPQAGQRTITAAGDVWRYPPR